MIKSYWLPRNAFTFTWFIWISKITSIIEIWTSFISNLRNAWTNTYKISLSKSRRLVGSSWWSVNAKFTLKCISSKFWFLISGIKTTLMKVISKQRLWLNHEFVSLEFLTRIIALFPSKWTIKYFRLIFLFSS